MAETIVNRRIIMASRPSGMPGPENFSLEEVEEPLQPPTGVRLKTLFFSLDPYMRGRMDEGPSYAQALSPGDVMEGGSVGEVIASADPAFSKGDIVLAYSGWQTHPVVKAKGLRKLDPSLAPVSTALGVLGMPGMTAYTGLLNIGHPKAGETLVVAAASGAVGSAVGQIGKIKGCRVVGIAGGAEKTRYVREELGFDVALDHRAPDFAEQLKAACPQGIDIYFENVGGRVWDLVFPLLNDFARVPVCGLISQYNGFAPRAPELPSVPELMEQVLVKRLRLQGFIVSDFSAQQNEFLHDMAGWISSGQVKYREDVVDGLEKAVPAFIGLLQGRNFGKLLVRP
ncbi:NADP-dependent oxidoreductase [Aestuariivirga sp.]|uniref:NADP-dependent oxidoreductase n=1 Tax=Aestuariivirga sp. TaxID=2650926 RepID=UPI003BACF874